MAAGFSVPISVGCSDRIGERYWPVAKHLFGDTLPLVNMKQRAHPKTQERRHTLARVGAYARRLTVCRARSERVKKIWGLGLQPHPELLPGAEGHDRPVPLWARRRPNPP